MTRWYAPAYRAYNGNVIPIGTPTVVLDDVKRAVASNADGGHSDCFVAYRDQPDWQRLEF